MKTSNTFGTVLKLAIAAAVLATSTFASVGASQAGWIYTPHGYVFCKVQNAVQWCN